LSGRVDCRIDGAVATVTLSHPARFNAMSRPMWRQLRAVFEQLQQDTTLRCVLLQGEGGHFCAGGDISEYPGFRFDEAALSDFHENEVWGGLSAVLACDLPVLAQIRGNCMGAGVEIASCCDIRLAGAAARFGAPIARLGFPMAPREAQLVAGAVGALTAREMLLGAAVLDAPVMLQRGFLNAVLRDDALVAEVARRVQTICDLGPQAARLNKRTLRALAGSSPALPQGLLDGAYRYADSAEHREGIAAFMDKRAPRF
jgi:enoyl-CoA hydratase/carnithine racemase